MKNVTIDTNCIIDLEEERESAKYIRSLIKMHKEGRISLRVVAIGASERKAEGAYASNFSEFKEKLERVGLGDVKILRPLGYWGMTFWGQALWTSEEMIQFEGKIHSILFPEIEFKCMDYFETRGVEYNEDSPFYRKWRNAKCDVLCMWAHIHYHGDVFVTNDLNFHKRTKRTTLISLGAGNILRPKEAVFYLKKYNSLTQRTH